MPVASRASLRFLLLRYARRTNNKTCGQSQKETPSDRMVFSFWSSTFAAQNRSPAGGRSNASGGTRQRFPPHTPPSLRYARVRTTKPEGNHRKKHHPSGWCFLFGMSRAGLNLLPRPARSALNQEVRQGSCEWLCHSWDAGSESSLVTLFAFAVCEAYKQQNLWAVTERNTIRQDGVFFFGAALLLRKSGRLRAGD